MAVKKPPILDRQALPPGILPWQGEGWARFAASLASNRLPHALLLGGARGTGKRHFAEQAATLMLCSAPHAVGSVEARACGSCKQCRLVDAGSHPDLTILEPEESRVIKVEQVRWLIEFSVRSPQVAQRKIAIIDSADQLNLNAANALLKTLEEPVDGLVLLLLHQSGEPLLPTIRSRCQVQRLPVPTSAQALQWMESLADAADSEYLDVALERARGAPITALDMLRGGQLPAGDECLESLRQYLKGERHLVDATAPFTRLGVEPSLDLLAHWAVAAMKLALGENDAVSGAGRDMLAFLARSNTAERFTSILDQITEARRLQVFNLNPELVINNILLSWKELMPRRQRAGARKVS